jgi:O-antigen/teichoic acid export membrane protein
LNDIERIEKLFALVIIAFTWAYLVGVFLHEQIKPIRMLKNGRMAKSYFKYGLTFIASRLLKC